MTSLEELLLNELEWRVDELSILKTTPYLYRVSQKQKDILQKYSIPAMYSLWEGFVKSAFQLYVDILNGLELSLYDLNINLITHDIDAKLKLSNSRSEYNKKIKFVDEIKKYFFENVTLSKNVPTQSNVNLEVINNILLRFNLDLISSDLYEKRLNKLLLIRNGVAHGENSIPISQDIIDELSTTIVSLMHEVIERILSGFSSKSYLA
jgi:hypothetical protein